MARRYKIKTGYDPYTYEQFAAPVREATAIANQQAQYLNLLASENAQLGAYLDPERDSAEYAAYVNNRDNLLKAVDEFNKHGLTNNVANAMLLANRAYYGTIRPIEQGVENKIKTTNLINAYLMEHPDVVLAEPIDKPVSAFMRGNMPQYKMISGKAIQDEVSELAKIIGAARQQYLVTGTYGKYHNIVKAKTGYDIDELGDVLNDPQSAINKVINDSLKKHGVIDINNNPLVANEQDFNKLVNYAKMGAYGALEKSESSIMENDTKTDSEIGLAWANYRLTAQHYRDERQDKIDERDMQIAASVAEQNGIPFNEALRAVGRNDLADQFNVNLPNNTTNKANTNFDSEGRAQIQSKYPLIPIRATDNLTIESGSVKIQKSAVSTVAGALEAAKNGNVSAITNTVKNNKYFKILVKQRNLDPNNLTTKDINDLYHTAMNDYRKLNYNSFYFSYSVPTSALTTDYKTQLSSLTNTNLSDAKSLKFQNNPDNPLKIDIYKDGNSDKTTSIDMLDLNNVLNVADYAELTAHSNILKNSNYKTKINNPTTSYVETRRMMEDVTLVSMYALDKFIDILNENIVVAKKATDVNDKNDN